MAFTKITHYCYNHTYYLKMKCNSPYMWHLKIIFNHFFSGFRCTIFGKHWWTFSYWTECFQEKFTTLQPLLYGRHYHSFSTRPSNHYWSTRVSVNAPRDEIWKCGVILRFTLHFYWIIFKIILMFIFSIECIVY